MDKELSFNNKISNWMSNQQFLFQADSIQENLLLLKRRIADTELSDIDKDLIEKIAEETLILSLIFANNKNKVDALINYLSA